MLRRSEEVQLPPPVAEEEQESPDAHVDILPKEFGKRDEPLLGNFLLHSCSCVGHDNGVSERGHSQKGVEDAIRLVAAGPAEGLAEEKKGDGGIAVLLLKGRDNGHVADVNDHVEDRDEGDAEGGGAGKDAPWAGDLVEHVVDLVEASVGEDWAVSTSLGFVGSLGLSLTYGKKRCGVAVCAAALESGVVSTRGHVPWRLEGRIPVRVVSEHIGDGCPILVLDASTNNDKSRDDDDPEYGNFDTGEEIAEPDATPARDRMDETSKSGG